MAHLRRGIILIVFLGLYNLTFGQDLSTSKYSPSAPHVALQAGSGIVFGALGATVGGLAGIAATPQDNEGFFPDSDYTPIGIYTGFAVGSALGVYIVANSKLYKASYGKILIGSTIGTTLSFAAFIYGIENPQGLILAVALPTIGGIIANSFTAEKREKSTSALLNISNSALTLALPSIQVGQVGNHNFRNKRSATVKLLNISL